MLDNNSILRVKRESVGIKGVDALIEGGVPKGAVVGLSGPPGVGKSIFSLHFLLEGARAGQRSVYINLEEPRRNIDKMIRSFSFSKEFYELEKRGLIIIKCFDYLEYEKVQSELLQLIREDNGIKRLVIDSFNCYFASLDVGNNSSSINIRKIIIEAIYKLRRLGLTTMLILEKGSNQYNVPYLVDGMIQLDYLEFGLIERRVSIPKMRWTKQEIEGRAYDIGDGGIFLAHDSSLV